MSIFYDDPPSTQKKQDDISTPGAIALIVGILGVIGYQKLPSTAVLYYRFYKSLYFGGYVAVALILIIAIYQIRKRTKKLTARALLLAQAGKHIPNAIRVGETTDGVQLYLDERTRCGHVQILGSTGRGKTESVIVPWMCRDIMAGHNTILIDGKGDPDVLEKIIRSANETGHCEVHVFDLGNPESSCTTNPLKSGSPQQITDRIFTAFSFEDPYYRAVQLDITGTVIQIIHSLGEMVTFKTIYKLLTDDGALTEVVGLCKSDDIKQKLTRHLTTPKGSREEKLSGLLSQLAPFAVGEVSELVNGESGTKQCWSVSDVIFRDKGDEGTQHVLAMLIPTLKYQQIGHQLGKLILQELGWAIGERASKKGSFAEFLPVHLDEFSAFVYPGFTNILNKARSSQVALHLSHQSLSDLALVSKEVAEIIVTNTNVKCILGLNDPTSADFMARHIGTESQEKLTEQAEERGTFSKREKTGRSSIREVEAYKIHPNLLKNFMNGRGVIHLPTPLGNISEEIQFAALSDMELYGKRVQE